MGCHTELRRICLADLAHCFTLGAKFQGGDWQFFVGANMQVRTR